MHWLSPRMLVVVVALSLVSGGGGFLVRRSSAPSSVPAQPRSFTISSKALGVPTQVNILLPDGYATGSQRYPVLYLLHGYNGSYTDWVRYTDVATFVRKLPLIVVMPDGGNGWYMNSSVSQENWETYHIDELIPYVDAHFRTIANRNGRAIAGLSMGGMGAFAYAARHPDLFVAAASFSGVLDPEHFSAPSDGALAPPSDVFASVCGSSVWCLRSHDPVDLAPNLRGMHLFLSSGNGKPGPLDTATTATATSEMTEVQVHRTLVSMAHALRSAHVPAEVDDYGNGTHNWPYWQRELHRAMPLLLAALTHPQPAPDNWSYRMVDTSATVWGYSITADLATGDRYTNLTNVGPHGLTVTGSGTIAVVTAPLYVAGHVYTITRNTTSQAMSTADRYGRLHVTIELGRTTTTQHIAIGDVR